MGLNIGVLTISNQGSIASDEVGEEVTRRLRAAGHRLVERDIVPNDRDAIRRQLGEWLQDPELDTVVALGGSHYVATLLARTTSVVGFSDLARWAVREHLSNAVAIRAEALQADNKKLVFALGGSLAAMQVVVEHVLIPQLDVRPDAGNLIALLPAPARSRKVTVDPPTQPLPLPALVVALQPETANAIEATEAVSTAPTAATTETAIVTPVERAPTDKISVIGDLPSIANPVALPDLRPRRGKLVAALAMFGAGATAAFVLNYFQTHGPVEAPPIVAHEQPRLVMPATTPHEAPSQPTTTGPVQPAPTPTATPASPPATTKPVTVKKPVTTKSAKPDETPADQTPVDPEEAPADPHMFEPCTEQSCVATNFERACCAPYKHAEPQLALALDQAMVADAIAPVMPQIEKCGDIGVRGTVKVHVTVRANGSVSESDPRESPDPSLGECVADAINHVRFPKTTNGGAFMKSFTF